MKEGATPTTRRNTGELLFELVVRIYTFVGRGDQLVEPLFLEERIAIVDARVVRMSRAVSEEQDDTECLAALQFTSVPTGDAARLRGYINN